MEVDNYSQRDSGWRQAVVEEVSGSGGNPYFENEIDLNEHLIKNRPSTFCLRVTGNSMINAAIHHGDIVIVDRSLRPQNGKVVIALVDGDLLIRRFEKTLNRVRLIPETSGLSPLELCEFNELQIWGVVIYVIKTV